MYTLAARKKSAVGWGYFQLYACTADLKGELIPLAIRGGENTGNGTVWHQEDE
jgi:hypothetical protein